jgi:hypothetical protein
MKVLKWILNTVVGLCAALALAFLCYDHLAFQPRRAEIDALITSAHPLDRHPPAALLDLLRVDLDGNLSSLAARQVLDSLNAVPRGNLAWQTKWALWWMLVRLHLSPDEQIAVVCSRTFFGKGIVGFQSAARGIFGRDLDELNELELAALVVHSRWPSRYRDPARAQDLQNATRALISRAHPARK